VLNDLDLCIPLKGEKSDKPDICREIAATIANALPSFSPVHQDRPQP